jgi:phosphatidylglycerol:prolipoprotein diacylglycerol transferase
VYLILNGLERFTIESIRVNPRYGMLNYSQAQYIALGLIAIGIAGAAILYSLWKRKTDSPAWK